MGLQSKRVGNAHGGEWAGPCPDCGGTDRFHLWPAENEGMGRYWCRRCERKGDAIQFCRDFKRMSFQDACRHLGIDRAEDNKAPAVAAPVAPRASGPATTQSRDPKEVWQERAEKFAAYAAEKLAGLPDRLAWLSGRGIDAAAVKRHGLGWNDADYYRPREAWGLEKELKDDGREKKVWLPAGLVIPVRHGGRIIRLRIRRESGEPRYVLVPGSSVRPFEVDCGGASASGGRCLVVVESELDAIMLACCCNGLPVTMFACGNTTVMPAQDQIGPLQRAEMILVSMDYDNELVIKAWDYWREHFRNARMWPVPVGKDPGEAYQQGCDMRQWVLAGLPACYSGQTSENDQKREKAAGARAGEGVVERLHALLKKYPVKILNNKSELRLIYTPEWLREHDAELGQISECVFSDEGLDYIRRHPAKLIDRSNYLIK